MKFLFTFLLLVFTSQTWALTILIDPGHGGEEDGATTVANSKNGSDIIREKDLSLAIAKKLYDELSKTNHTVFMTRSLDRTVTLAERAAIAEKTKADLFISVHINSSPQSGAVGFETYYLDNNNDIAIKKVEKTENITAKGEEVVIQQILIDLVIDQTISISKPLAESIHSEIKSDVGRKYGITSRGIKPALFYVLALSKRPGVLLEVGFLSTQKERIRMMNPKFQSEYAHAVAKGIEKFIRSQKKPKAKS